MKKLLFLILLLTVNLNAQEITGFYLSRYSPVIDKGTMDVYLNVQGLDFYGNPRLQGRSLDIGAAEFQDPWDRIVVAKVTENSVIFRGQSIELMASGGEIYQWSNGMSGRVITVSPDITTTYVVTVEEYGVVATAEVTIFVRDPIVISPIANIGDDIAECSGKNIMLTVNENETATYQWSTGQTTNSIVLTLNESILVSVTIKDGDITSTDSVMIYVNDGCP